MRCSEDFDLQNLKILILKHRDRRASKSLINILHLYLEWSVVMIYGYLEAGFAFQIKPYQDVQLYHEELSPSGLVSNYSKLVFF